MAVATPTSQIGDAFKNRKTTMPLIDDLVFTKSTAGLNRRGWTGTPPCGLTRQGQRILMEAPPRLGLGRVGIRNACGSPSGRLDVLAQSAQQGTLADSYWICTVEPATTLRDSLCRGKRLAEGRRGVKLDTEAGVYVSMHVTRSNVKRNQLHTEESQR